MEAFHASLDLQVRVSLVKLVSEYRTASAVPFLVMALGDRKPEIWKAALDGLAILGGAVALEGLREARANAPREQRAWIDDAMQDIIEEA